MQKITDKNEAMEMVVKNGINLQYLSAKIRPIIIYNRIEVHKTHSNKSCVKF